MTPREPKASDWRGGRAGASTSSRFMRYSAIQRFRGPASGMAGDRGDDLAGVQSRERKAQRRERNAGQFVKRASFARSVKEIGPAIPGHGNGPLSSSLPAWPA